MISNFNCYMFLLFVFILLMFFIFCDFCLNLYLYLYSETFSGRFDTSGSMIPLSVPEISPCHDFFDGRAQTFTPTCRYFYTDISVISVTFCISGHNIFRCDSISYLPPTLSVGQWVIVSQVLFLNIFFHIDNSSFSAYIS